MRVSEAAAAKAYDVASLRERVLRDELDKAVGAGRSDDADGISTETQRRIQDAKNTCDWAAGLEEGRKAQERSVEEAKRLLIIAEDRARETLKDAGDTYGEFARMTEGSYFISHIQTPFDALYAVQLDSTTHHSTFPIPRPDCFAGAYNTSALFYRSW